MYRVWITKHISEFCGTNVQQYFWSKGEQSPKCDFCGDQDEYTTHICRCRDPGRVQMFQISVQEVFDWMSKTLRRTDMGMTICQTDEFVHISFFGWCSFFLFYGI